MLNRMNYDDIMKYFGGKVAHISNNVDYGQDIASACLAFHNESESRIASAYWVWHFTPNVCMTIDKECKTREKFFSKYFGMNKKTVSAYKTVGQFVRCKSYESGIGHYYIRVDEKLNGLNFSVLKYIGNKFDTVEKAVKFVSDYGIRPSFTVKDVQMLYESAYGIETPKNDTDDTDDTDTDSADTADTDTVNVINAYRTLSEHISAELAELLKEELAGKGFTDVLAF